MPTRLNISDRLHWQHVRLSWGAIIAGCAVALSAHLVLVMLAMGIGVRFINPYTTDNPLLSFTAAIGIAWSISALISLWLGGWMAGRTCGHGYGNIGGLHGVVVWAVLTVASAAILTTGGSLLAGSAINLVSHAASGAAAGMAANPQLTNPANAYAAGEEIPELLNNFLDEIMIEVREGNPPANGQSGPAMNYVRARRELGSAIFLNYSNPASQANHSAMTRALITNAHKSPTEAEVIVSQWDLTFNRVDQAAKAAADRGRRALVKIGAWTFLAFALGAFGAGWGGFRGARRAATFYVISETIQEQNPTSRAA